MNNNTTTTKPSAPADESAQIETAAVMLSDILNTIEANDFSFVSLRWIHSQGKAALAVLETGEQGKATARVIALGALRSLFEHCTMVHKHWGDGSNQREADTAIENAKAAIAVLEREVR